MLYRIIPALLASGLLFASGVFADSKNVELSNGWINNLPPSVPMRAGYLLLENDGGLPVTVIRIESEAFNRVEMHETRMENGLMKMVEIGRIEIPAEGKAELKPGGMHLMMMGPQIDLPPGTEVPVTLHFNDGGSLDTLFEVRQ